MVSKNVKIHRDTRVALREFQDDKESINDAVNRLLDLVEDDLNDSTRDLYGFTNIELDIRTMERVKSLGLASTESYDSVLRRCLSLYSGRV